MTFFLKQSDRTDENDIGVLNLGLYLSLLDRVIRKYNSPSDFTIEDEEYMLVLRLVSTKRKLNEETTDECFKRLMKQSKIFETIYHQRGGMSIYCPK